MLMERAMVKDSVEKARASNAEFDRIFGSYYSGSSSGSSSSSPALGWLVGVDELLKDAKMSGGKFMWRTSWSYTEEIHMLQAVQIILESLRAMKTNQFLKPQYDLMEGQISSLGLTNAGEALIRALKIPDFRELLESGSLGIIVSKNIRIEAARRVVVAAIALKRFQLRHGKLSETLGELAPEFFAAVPIDPYDGKPLRYHPNTDGTYLLYCVGEDGVDDGGDPTNTMSGSSGRANFY